MLLKYVLHSSRCCLYLRCTAVHTAQCTARAAYISLLHSSPCCLYRCFCRGRRLLAANVLLHTASTLPHCHTATLRMYCLHLPAGTLERFLRSLAHLDFCTCSLLTFRHNFARKLANPNVCLHTCKHNGTQCAFQGGCTADKALDCNA